MPQSERIKQLNNKAARRGKYVLYWMQAAQRAYYNHALEYAIEKANERSKPLLVVFGLTEDYPQANLRHYWFMLEGLRETQNTLADKGIKMIVMRKSPDKAAIEFGKDAELVIVDGGQLRIQRKWRQEAARKIGCALFEVETNLIIPVTETSGKEEFAARTIRPKIHKKLDYYMAGMKHKKVKKDSLGLKFDEFDISDIEKATAKLKIDKSVKPVEEFIGGTSNAKKHLSKFIREKLDDYDELRNDPTLDYQSNMSAYLHFGQISPLYIAMQAAKSKAKGKDAYLEELIVRRELSHNFVYYNDKYDKPECIEPWSKRTLNYHNKDKREYIYTLAQFEQAETHDPYWNAAQREMMLRGKMHGYMRMYWGKKILEWTKSW
ncbi:MAG: deoxyribodipyrimidine photo-lyase, partial [Oscillospiraceae bacterium]